MLTTLIQIIGRMHAKRREMICGATVAPVFLATYYCAYWLRFDGNLTSGHCQQIAATIIYVLVIKLALFAGLRFFQGWSRHATFHDLVVLVEGATLGSIAVFFVDRLVIPSSTIPRGVLLIDWGLTILAVGGARTLTRLIDERRVPHLRDRAATRALIVGANNAGEALLRAIRRDGKLKYDVVGFITEDKGCLGSRIAGVPIRGMLTDTQRLAQKHNVQEVLLAADQLPGRKVREVVEECRKCNVEVKVVPSYEQLLHGNVAIQPRTVSIEDLLRRDRVNLDLPGMRRWLDDRVLLVTGSAGSIGSEICRQLLQFAPRKLVLVDRSECGQFFLERELRRLAPHAEIQVCMADVTDGLRMSRIFREHQPEIVFHAAAYKHVPLMEANSGEAVKNITLATRLVADLANQHNVAAFVLISTDKAVNPTSVMGACKRVAELYVQSLASRSKCRFTTVRFGNVLDSAGSVVPIFREQIARGGPVTVTHPDMVRYFMTIPEASQLVIQAGAMGKGGEIFVLDMGEPVKIVELATDMIRLSGLKVDDDIEIRFSGIRPGEKLYEELNAAGENHVPTVHPKIRVAEGRELNYQKTREAVTALSRMTENANSEIIAALQAIVPEFLAPVEQTGGRQRIAA